VTPSVLAIGGYDPSGGAGVEADRSAAEGASVRAVVTAWTDQGEGGVRGVRPRPEGAWVREAEAELARQPGAIKTGMLAGEAAVRALAELLARGAPGPVVVDPVLAPTRGAAFLDEAGRAALLERLVALADVLTPNLPEAAALVGESPEALAADDTRRLHAAAELLRRGAAAVVLKGGHADGAEARDLVLAAGGEPLWIARPRLPGGVRGSGCRFASSLAASLAAGASLEEAARRAGDRVAALIAARGAAPSP
jgi:hydroxymethylpyrimidine/phosphomethylpyrimidine kinase